MSDIVHQLLAQADAPGVTRARNHMARAAALLYRECMTVCETFDLPHTAARVEVYARGAGRACLLATQEAFVWAPELGRFEAHHVLPPRGPYDPFGRAWVELDKRPARLRHKKQPRQDLYKADVARWGTHAHGDEFLYRLWSYQRHKKGVYVYQSELGDVCEHCREALTPNQDVFITYEQKLYCEGCARAQNVTLDMKPFRFYRYLDHCAKIARLIKDGQRASLQTPVEWRGVR